MTHEIVALVTVDYENNAEQWWDALRAHPRGAEIETAVDGSGGLTAEQLAFCRSLAGWADGPEWARTALQVEELKAATDAAIGRRRR